MFLMIVKTIMYYPRINVNMDNSFSVFFNIPLIAKVFYEENINY